MNYERSGVSKEGGNTDHQEFGEVGIAELFCVAEERDCGGCKKGLRKQIPREVAKTQGVRKHGREFQAARGAGSGDEEQG